jgi:hypothetical protein
MEALTGSVVRPPQPAISSHPRMLTAIQTLITDMVLGRSRWFILVSDFRDQMPDFRRQMAEDRELNAPRQLRDNRFPLSSVY